VIVDHCVELTGGLLMEIFIVQTGKAVDLHLISGCYDEKKSIALSEDKKKELEKRFTLPFWLFLASTLHQINQKVIYPLTLWTMLLEFRGLSRLGRILSNYCNLAPSIRTYDAVRNRLLNDASQEIESITESGSCVFAIDNYTHLFGTSSLRLTGQKQYQTPTYTVGALIQWPTTFKISLRFL
jgi:hypothetical protein